jgi:hypothetical protein
MINGERGAPISMARGVRQGDPLSPTLFILTMDSLQAMMQWVAEHGFLEDLYPGCPFMRTTQSFSSGQQWVTWR